jgi:hypothetical protein
MEQVMLALLGTLKTADLPYIYLLSHPGLSFAEDASIFKSLSWTHLGYQDASNSMMSSLQVFFQHSQSTTDPRQPSLLRHLCARSRMFNGQRPPK